jgi:argininosuccinate lyase
MTTQKPSVHRTWGGRFKGSLADAMLRLSASVDVDRALAEYDIEGSLAHARALLRAGVLTADELERGEGLEPFSTGSDGNDEMGPGARGYT